MKTEFAVRPLPPLSIELKELLPSQQRALASLKRAVQVSPVTVYSVLPHMGASVVLKCLAEHMNADYIDHVRLSQLVRAYPPTKWEEVIYDLLHKALKKTGAVVFECLNDVRSATLPRENYFNDVLQRHIQDLAIRNNWRIVFGVGELRPWESVSGIVGDAAAVVSSGSLLVEDYATFLHGALGDMPDVDVAQLHRAASVLDLYQLQTLVNLVRLELQPLTTAGLVNLIETHLLRTNLRLQEVEALSFDSLPGTEHIAEALETHIVLPFENKQAAQEYGLKPRRGVLLYGPPGTGKTSIGRALAHRMKGRFFLIDGSFITEPPHLFFEQVEAVIREAKENSPSVLFIDDADVLFQIEHVAGLSRYLLSLLDGLESETASNVCVMMTAMDAKKVPEALLRSGRVELWLETKAPDETTRGQILRRWMVSDMPGHNDVDYDALARETAGFTPADLRRLAGDARLLYAADVVADNAPGSAQQYLHAAITDLIALRETMAQQLADDSLRVRHYA